MFLAPTSAPWTVFCIVYSNIFANVCNVQQCQSRNVKSCVLLPRTTCSVKHSEMVSIGYEIIPCFRISLVSPKKTSYLCHQSRRFLHPALKKEFKPQRSKVEKYSLVFIVSLISVSRQLCLGKIQFNSLPKVYSVSYFHIISRKAQEHKSLQLQINHYC